MDPKIVDVPPEILFKTPALAPGVLKWTEDLVPTLKLCQFIIPWFVVWLITNFPGSVWLIEMLPFATDPPVGSAKSPMLPAKEYVDEKNIK